MKKFAIVNISIIIISMIILKIGLINLSDAGMLRKGNELELKDCTAQILVTSENIDISYSNAQEYIDTIRKISEMMGCEEFNVLYVTSTGNNSFGIRSADYSFKVNKVFEGDISLQGSEIITYTPPCSLFEEFLEEESMDRLKEYFNSLGFSPETKPWLYENRCMYYSFTNVPKENYNYIICVGKLNYSENAKPLYLILDKMLFSEVTASNDKLLSFDDVPIYCNYQSNFTFFYRQEDLDSYVKLQKELFQYYLP